VRTTCLVEKADLNALTRLAQFGEAHAWVMGLPADPYYAAVGEDYFRRHPMSVDYGKLTPVLTAAVKELIARVEKLETRVTELEGQNPCK
jgi:hypothetical protein